MKRNSEWPIATALAALLISPAAPVRAESLQCNGHIASEGDTRLSVLHKCGQPTLKDSACAPVYYQGSLDRVPEPWASAYVPCLQAEEWLYDRGPGNLMATVRFRSGVVESIRYGRTPR